MLTLTNVQDAIGLKIAGDFIRDELKIEPAETNKRAMFFSEAQFPLICAALIVHIDAVKNGKRLDAKPAKERKSKKEEAAPSVDDLF